MKLSIKDKFINNPAVHINPYFQYPVRNSAEQRLKYHPAAFGKPYHYSAVTSGLFALAYYGITARWIYMLKQSLRAVAHKGALGLAFFYTQELVWGWVSSEKTQDPKKQSTEIRSWSTNYFTSVLLFPLIVGLNLFYRHPMKRLLKRSFVDALALGTFGLILDTRIQGRRKVLLGDDLELKKLYYEM